MMLTLLFLTLTMMADAKNTTSAGPLKKSTTTETDYWERCQGGKGSGPRGYARLCDGKHHGECIGTKGEIADGAHDTDACADKCNDADDCAGFEYDTLGDEESCTLFEAITGLKPTKKESHLFTHECFKKEVVKANVCESVASFSGRFQRMCDGKKHGVCTGKQLGPRILHDTAQLCASACDRNSTCAGFEYDTDEDSDTCFLFSQVQGAEYNKHSKKSNCYKKSSLISTTTSGGTETQASTVAGDTAKEASTASRTKMMFVLSIIMTFLISTN